MPRYAELHVATNFSFLRGASHAEELATTAAALGLHAIGVTDRNTLAGVVRMHLAAKAAGIRPVIGCRVEPQDGLPLLVWPEDRAGYAALSRLLTVGLRRAPKGECRLTIADVAGHARLGGAWRAALVPPATALGAGDRARVAAELSTWRGVFGPRLSLAAAHLYRGDDARRLHRLQVLADDAGVPMMAAGDVLMHSPARRALADVLACIREKRTVHDAGWILEANAERHLKAPDEVARLFRRHPRALDRSVEVADACRFSLDELVYEYPEEVVDPGETPQETLARLTAAGAAERYPGGVPDRVAAQIRHELALIDRLGYAPYFLTVHDVVRFARSRGILCQGRGSAANSAVCYVLGITAVDPAKADLLFERFVSDARDEPPDIDVDFEHERREEVIQYVYAKYGRHRAGLAATVIRYRARGAIREVGKAMGLTEDVVGRLSGSIWGWGTEAIGEDRAREQGLDPQDPALARTLGLARELIGFPRHLSQHVGGFVIARGRLDELCPVLNAAMPDRTTIEWDKDDIDALGILKVDVLALGMLTCVRKAFDMIAAAKGPRYELATVPAEDPAVYDMLCRADSIGVFQVESRAQMTMLPRLKPRAFYDLVVEVAIVRPGPIQGDMVHPYLRRRQGLEKVEFPSDELRAVLGKTLGVPLFQEQAMKIAIVAAGFTPAEADRLRRAMATFRKVGFIHEFRDKLVEGMAARGYDRGFAERCFRQIEGFGTYGFPESHAASFALLVYVSAWIKCRHPDVFAAALLNSQPMGFYAPAQIVRDAAEHGVEVRPPDVNASGWDCTLEAPARLRPGRDRPGRSCRAAGAGSAGQHADGAGGLGERQDRPVPRDQRDVERPGGGDQKTIHGIAADRPRQARRVQGDRDRRIGETDPELHPEQLDPGVRLERQADPSAGVEGADLVDGQRRDPDPAELPRRLDPPAHARRDPLSPVQPDDRVRVEQHRPSARDARQRIEQVLRLDRRAGQVVALGDPDHASDARPVHRLQRPPLADDLGDHLAVAHDQDAQDPHVRDVVEVARGVGGEVGRVHCDLGHDRLVVPADEVVHGASPVADPGTVAHPEPSFHATRHALRLGLRQVKGLSEAAGRAVEASRPPGGYRDVADLARRAGLRRADVEALAEADCFRSMGLDRRRALWAAKALGDAELPLFAGSPPPPEPAAHLPEMALGEHVVEDYARLRLSLKAHPMALLREAVAADLAAGAADAPAGRPAGGRHPRHMPTALVGEGEGAAGGGPRPGRRPVAGVSPSPRPSPRGGEGAPGHAFPPRSAGGPETDLAGVPSPPRGEGQGGGGPQERCRPRAPSVPRLVRACELAGLPHGRAVAVAGLVLVRQRPGSANGVVFVTLEDETGVANLVVLPPQFERFRKVLLGARLMLCRGRVERVDQVVHVRADHLADVSGRLRDLTAEPPPDWAAGALARADEVRRPTPDQREDRAAARRFPDGRNFR
jgi:error-prone DNA polymerase